MDILPYSEFHTENSITYSQRRPPYTSKAQKTRGAMVFYWKPGNIRSTAQVQVQTRFASPPDGDPTLRVEVRYIDESNTHLGMVEEGQQGQVLDEVAKRMLPCGKCDLKKAGTCGLERMEKSAWFTDADKYDLASQKIRGHQGVITLPGGTSASDVKCIQP